ncbi:hypothetical protein [Ideonella livida]|uniref:Uncharacterized protein n=1 Tax=Ideonella livida TaxID=2707176 RepID=A0A7C9TMN2_9BURK|nr:hypothetical protein [Ideonella livida]NDY93083.1 hypothetical protein [Ideonella livida]
MNRRLVPALSVRRRALPALLSAVALACLGACGGGGGEEAEDAAVTDEASAQAYVAVAATSAQSVSAGLESAATLAETAAAETATAQAAAASGRRQAQAANDRTVTAPATWDCPGGGSLTLTVQGTATGVLNGQPDSGEVYALDFAQCVSADGVVLTGGARLSYDTATVAEEGGTTRQLRTGRLQATALAASATSVDGERALAVTLDGTVQFSRQVDQQVDDSGVTEQRQTHLAGSGLAMTVATTRGGSQRWQLDDLDLSRQTQWQADSFSAGQLHGGWTLSLPARGWQMSTRIDSTLALDAQGALVSGRWVVTLPRVILDSSAAAGVVTVQVDQGADGSVDKTYSWTLGRLVTVVSEGV